MADQRGITHKKPEDIAFKAMSSGTITLLLTTKLTVTQFIAKGVPKSYFKTGTDPLKSHISEDQPADCATDESVAPAEAAFPGYGLNHFAEPDGWTSGALGLQSAWSNSTLSEAVA